MLILLTMTAVGLISVHRTNTDLLVAGNVSRMSQASIASDAGLFETLGLVGWQPGQYARLLASRRTLGLLPSQSITLPSGSWVVPTCDPLDENNDNTLDSGSMRMALSVTCRSSRQPDPTGAGAKRYLPTLDLAGAKGLEAQNAAYEVEAIFIKQTGSDTAGNSTQNVVCYQTWDYSSRGGVPSREADVMTSLCERENPSCRPDGVVTESRSRAVSGPLPCK
jgi:hypothetical protein